MITFEKKTELQKIIAKWLISNSNVNKTVVAHTRTIEREIIPDGIGCTSVSRYLRAMRQQGFIEYKDPRKNYHIYVIHIKPKLFDWLKEEE